MVWQACRHISHLYVRSGIPYTGSQNTVKPLNFARDLISLILQVMKIREIKYPRKFKFYID